MRHEEAPLSRRETRSFEELADQLRRECPWAADDGPGGRGGHRWRGARRWRAVLAWWPAAALVVVWASVEGVVAGTAGGVAAAWVGVVVAALVLAATTGAAWAAWRGWRLGEPVRPSRSGDQG